MDSIENNERTKLMEMDHKLLNHNYKREGGFTDFFFFSSLIPCIALFYHVSVYLNRRKELC